MIRVSIEPMYERLTDLERPSAAPGRILALDLGEKRIGVALSDEYQRIARPYRVIRRSSRLTDFAAIARMVDLEDVVFIVVGLPYLLSEEEGSKAAWIQDYSADLASSLGLRVEVSQQLMQRIVFVSKV